MTLVAMLTVPDTVAPLVGAVIVTAGAATPTWTMLATDGTPEPLSMNIIYSPGGADIRVRRCGYRQLIGTFGEGCTNNALVEIEVVSNRAQCNKINIGNVGGIESVDRK